MKKIIRRENGTTRVITINDQKSQTQQQFKEQCDVNNILAKFKKTGELTHLSRKQGQYLDLANLPSYQESLHAVIKAEQSFKSLPSEVRKQFRNDPQEMIQFLSDPKNKDKAIELGLVQKIEPKIDYQKELYDEVKKQNQKQKNTTTKKPETVDTE